MFWRPPISTLTDTVFPYTTFCRSLQWEGWWLRSQRGARAGIAAAMPSASQSDRVDGPLLRGRSPDLRVGVEDSGRGAFPWTPLRAWTRSEEHTSELQSLMRISYAVFCLKNKTHHTVKRTLRS